MVDAPREQEQQIKERKRLLYEADEAPAASSSVARKPFSTYLRETPAAPLPGGVKAALWGAAVVVALLLVGALLKSMQGKAPAKKRAEARPAAISSPRFV